MDRIHTSEVHDQVESFEPESLLELSDLHLAMVGGGIADVIGV